MSQLEFTKRRISLSFIVGAGLVAQFLSIYPLWGHESSSSDFLGRYSSRYAIILVLNIAFILIWSVGFIQRRWLATQFTRLPIRLRFLLLLVSGAVVAALSFTSIEPPAKQYLALNWLLWAAIILYTMPDQPSQLRWTWAYAAALILLLPLFITALGQDRFTPDEAHWADYATSAFRAGGVYSRTWLQEPVTISPGIGWSVAAYGWTLEHVAFDIKTGRTWNFIAYLLAFAGVGAVTWRLYGRQAALISTTFAALSQAFIPALDYRPDHQLPAAVMWITFAALQGRYRKRLFWHGLCGLLATLALQLHAAAIVFVFGFGLFYLMEAAGAFYSQRQWKVFLPLIAFTIGSFFGSSLYYIANVQSVGGLGAFLQFLITTRGSVVGAQKFWLWPSLLEWMLILGGLAYVAWRRNAADRLLLGILICVLIGIVLFDTQGYSTHFSAFYVVPVGTLILYGLASPELPRGKNQRAVYLALCLLAMLIATAANFIDWRAAARWARTGTFPPFLYTELRPALQPYIRPDDTVISTHQLIWTLPEQANLINVGAEVTAMNRWKITDPVEVWERVQPTVLVMLEKQMTLNPGLEVYLARHQWQLCTRLQVMETNIQIYRPVCPATKTS
jgi:hypothetical protein